MKLKGLLIMQLQKGSHNKLLISCYYLIKSTNRKCFILGQIKKIKAKFLK